MDTKPRVVRSRRRRWVRRRHRRLNRRRLTMAFGVAILLALSVPYLMGGWSSLVEQAATNLIYGSNVEIKAREAGQKLAKKRSGLTEHQLTLAFDKRVNNLKDPVSKEPISGILLTKARRAFIKGYQGKKEEAGKAER